MPGVNPQLSKMSFHKVKTHFNVAIWWQRLIIVKMLLLVTRIEIYIFLVVAYLDTF